MSHPSSTLTTTRVRFAPSPTGALHMGSALVALANAAFARGNAGALVLRIDDTDAARSREEDTLELIRLLRWLEIDWDEGPVHQRDRASAYRIALDALVERGLAYPCFCGDARLAELRASQERLGQPSRYDGRCRALDPAEVERSLAAGAPHVLRFAVPDGRDVRFDDLVRGPITVPAGSFGDPVLARSDGSAGYLLASVVDDLAHGITHVLRGEDHLHNTARQVLLFEAIDPDAPLPHFAHLPLLRDADGRKLSKRDPLGTLDEIVDEGFLPRTIRRYLAELLGQGALDLLDADEPPRRFLFDRVPTGAPKVDRVRLESLGREDMARLSVVELLDGTGRQATAENEPVVLELAALSPSRVHLRGELRLVFDGPGPGDLPHVLRIVGADAERINAFDRALGLAVDELRVDIEAGSDTGTVWAAPFVQRLRAAGSAAELKTRDLLQALRIALTGTTGGPGLDLLLSAIGAREALRRVHLARVVLDEPVERPGGEHGADG